MVIFEIWGCNYISKMSPLEAAARLVNNPAIYWSEKVCLLWQKTKLKNIDKSIFIRRL